ncbi:MAG TPA: BLUF domain-containing protein [Burkholderiaceae bacterium]
MPDLIRIVYVSRSTFVSSSGARGIEPNVARILAKSRVNNRENGLVGVLYFGDGCFFQCLEGDAAAVDALYKKLEADKRHADLKLLIRDKIARPTFSEWSMKYVPSEKEVWNLLREEKLNAFDPYKLSEQGIQRLLALLLESRDPDANATPDNEEPPPHASAALPMRRKKPRSGTRYKRLVGPLMLTAATLLLIFWAAHR